MKEFSMDTVYESSKICKYMSIYLYYDTYQMNNQERSLNL